MTAIPTNTAAKSPLPVSVRFSMRLPADRVYLVVHNPDGSTNGWLEMARHGVDRWEATILLVPGDYRYRFYAETEGVTTYIPPIGRGGVLAGLESLDAPLHVPADAKSQIDIDEYVEEVRP